MKVKNMLSKNGNQVANQFEIYHNGNRTFQSYSSIIAEYSQMKEKTILTLDPIYWNYSRTTSKYLALFMDHDDLLIEIKKWARKQTEILEGKTFEWCDNIVVFNNLN